MTVSDMERRDLYNGLEEVLGSRPGQHAEMTYLSADPGALATKADMDMRFGEFERRFERVENALLEVNRRLDRLFFAVVTALLAMLVTVWTQIVLG